MRTKKKERKKEEALGRPGSRSKQYHEYHPVKTNHTYLYQSKIEQQKRGQKRSTPRKITTIERKRKRKTSLKNKRQESATSKHAKIPPMKIERSQQSKKETLAPPKNSPPKISIDGKKLTPIGSPNTNSQKSNSYHLPNH